jgi:hypothetical protein
MRHDDLRELTALAHTVPGVTLRLHCTSGNELLVSSTCLGADLDPCRLRATLLRERGRGHLAAGIDRAELVAGLRPLGAGLYQRAGAADERWFVTPLAPSTVVAAITDDAEDAADQPADEPRHAAFHTIVKPDPELGLHTVCVSAGPDSAVAELDEAAVWALGRVLVAELTAQLHHPAVRRAARPQLPGPTGIPSQPLNQHPQRKEHP